MKSLHVLGGSLSRVHASLVPGAALAHELHVGFGLDNLALNIIQRGLGADQVVVQQGRLGLETAQLRKLGKRRLAVIDLVQARVEGLQIQQPPLTARVGFQDLPPVVSIPFAPITKSHGSVRSVQM